MKRLRKLLGLIIIPITLLSMASVTPVQARPPEIWEVTFDVSSRLEGNQCGFKIIVRDFGTKRFQIFYDQNGMPIGSHEIYGQLYETWSAHGKSLDVDVKGPLHIDYVSDTEWIFKVLGTNYYITVPGYGRVFGWAGNLSLIYNPQTEEFISLIREAGAKSLENWNVICDFLG